ncbi:hypothetical protein QJS10_CPB19g01271 [Acorus calamus]|uniref:Uncharacterized protein n=1 Tax=Acorus calamus TaxID=4465 RepID=A0AAV9CIV8_ACOCL|nr:hypothetical protein QJS10_CPB19g01271 [Acorus calamus]
MATLLGQLLFPPPPSAIVAAMSAISLVSLANAGASEVRGRHLQYSKFWDSQPNKVGIKISSRAGMFALYAPAAIAGLVSFGFPAVAASPRGWLLSLALSVHLEGL